MLREDSLVWMSGGVSTSPADTPIECSEDLRFRFASKVSFSSSLSHHNLA